MSDGQQRDASDHETVYRTVGKGGSQTLVYEHPIMEVTPAKVRVGQKPVRGNVMGFQQIREGGVYVLDRKELEEEGCCHVQYGPTQTSFYLERSDVEGPIEEPPGATEDESSELDLRSIPTDTLQAEVVEYFEQVVSTLERRYEEGFSRRLLIEIALRQALVDLQMHGKDSPLVEQLDSISIGPSTSSSELELQAMPVDRMRADVVKYLKKVTSVLAARYDGSFSERHFLEVALQQMYADLRVYQYEATVVLWLDVLLEE